MNVRVRLFAAARELVGRDTIEVSLSAPATIADLRAALPEQFPPLANLTKQVMFAIGTDYADDTRRIPPGAEVACIPPVSGG